MLKLNAFMKYTTTILFASILFLVSCQNENENKSTTEIQNNKSQMNINDSFDAQGHRGARGLAPENTIPAFLKALEYGMTTLELDVVISKDGEFVVSHEPWFNHSIALQPNGAGIKEENEQSFNLYQMNYDEIAKYDVGSLGNPNFLEQAKQNAAKPTLQMVVEATTRYLLNNDLLPVYFNIETKTTPDGDNIFHPEPKEFVEKLYNEIHRLGIEEFTTIQSFDTRTLEILHQMDSTISTALLIYHEDDGNDNIQKSLKTLSFKPNIYSCYYKYVTEEMIDYAHLNNIKVIPWTVNEPEEMKRFIEMGVDGLITDYPDRLNELRITN